MSLIPLGRRIERPFRGCFYYSTTKHISPKPPSRRRWLKSTTRARVISGITPPHRAEESDTVKTNAGIPKDPTNRRHVFSVSQSILGRDGAGRRYNGRAPDSSLETVGFHTEASLHDRVLKLRALYLQYCLHDTGREYSNVRLWERHAWKTWTETHWTTTKAVEILKNGEKILEDGQTILGKASPRSSVSATYFADLSCLWEVSEARPPLSKRKELLRTFNALTSRTERLSGTEYEWFFRYGLFLAAEAHSPNALSQYSKRLNSIESGPSIPPAVLLSVRRWLSEDRFDGPDGQRRQAELRACLMPTWGRITRDGGKLSFMWLCQPYSEATLGNLLSIFSTLNEPRAILRLWLDIKKSASWSLLRHDLIPRKSSGAPSVYVRVKDRRREYQNVVHDFVQHLMITDAPRLAWALVSSLEPKMPDLLPQTWSMLFDHPEYMPELLEKMHQHLLPKYEEYLRSIETVLGIQWSGGEDGFHKLVDEDEEAPAAEVMSQYA